MRGLTTARTELKEVLDEAGFHVEDHVPEMVVPPLVSFRPGYPYLEPGDTLGNDEAFMRLEVLIVAEGGTNQDAIENLESAIENLWVALGETDWIIEAVGQPFYSSHQGFEYPTVAITINNIITIEGGN